MPGRTSAWLFEQVHSHLVYLRDLNSKTILPNQFAAPAARIQTLVNGAVRTRLPSRKRWVQAYINDTELCAVRNLAVNPSFITSKTLATVNHNYRGPLRQSLISVKADMLILREPISKMSSFTCLQLVPNKLTIFSSPSTPTLLVDISTLTGLYITFDFGFTGQACMPT